MRNFFRTVIILSLSLSIILLVGVGKASEAPTEFESAWWTVSNEGSVIDPELQAWLDAAEPEDMISVIVTLKNQVDFSKIGGDDRGSRLEALVTALQAKASGTQTPIINLLEDWQAQGLVAEYASFWVFNGLEVTATPDVITELANHPLVLRITPNESTFEPSIDYASPSETNVVNVNAPALWDRGYRGQGIVVATMDTGVYLNHPDLANQWRGGSNSWFDPYGEHPDTPTDLDGHGTQTMGAILGGDGGGTIIGVAPEAQWIAVKIFNDQGQATTEGIHAGYQWLLDPDGNPSTPDAPHVVNNSWTFQSPGCNLEFQLDLQALRAAGILPVFSAGNSGPTSSSSVSPPNYPEALAVGAVDDNDQIYAYSSRGPSACGEAETIFPEMVAPGVNIRTTGRYGTYGDATGTSVAAPHVSGALALLISAFPDLTVSQQASALTTGAVDLGPAGPDNDFGNGRLDVLAAYQIIQSGSLPTATPTADPGTNLALNKTVWVSSSQDSSHSGDMAVDNNLDTHWQSKKASGKKVSSSEWIKVDLGDNMTLSQVVLEWDNNYATAYNLKVSEDNQTWSTIFSTSTGNGGKDSLALNSVLGRYVMMESSAWSDSSLRAWLKELQVYGPGGNPGPTNTPTPLPTQDPPTPTATSLPTEELPTSTPTPLPTQEPPTTTPTVGSSVVVHVGDLDGSSSLGSKNRWNAAVTITVHDTGEFPVSNVTVSGSWSGAASNNASCTTDGAGKCSVSVTNLKTSASGVTFSVSDVSGSSILYQPDANHDADGDSDGSSVTVVRP